MHGPKQVEAVPLATRRVKPRACRQTSLFFPPVLNVIVEVMVHDLELRLGMLGVLAGLGGLQGQPNCCARHLVVGFGLGGPTQHPKPLRLGVALIMKPPEGWLPGWVPFSHLRYDRATEAGDVERRGAGVCSSAEAVQ